jgi:hypothetical protein
VCSLRFSPARLRLSFSFVSLPLVASYLSPACPSSARPSPARRSPARLSPARLSPARSSPARPSPAHPSLSCAPLSCTSISCAPLSCAPLSCAPLSCAHLSCAPLSCAPLSCVPLSCVPLSCAPLSCVPLSCVPLSCVSAPHLCLFCCLCPAFTSPFLRPRQGGAAAISCVSVGASLHWKSSAVVKRYPKVMGSSLALSPTHVTCLPHCCWMKLSLSFLLLSASFLSPAQRGRAVIDTCRPTTRDERNSPEEFLVTSPYRICYRCEFCTARLAQSMTRIDDSDRAPWDKGGHEVDNPAGETPEWTLSAASEVARCASAYAPRIPRVKQTVSTDHAAGSPAAIRVLSRSGRYLSVKKESLCSPQSSHASPAGSH